MPGGSFLDTLLVAAAGQVKTSGSPLVTSGQSVIALPGQLVLCDPTLGTLSVTAPGGPALFTLFGVADATAQSATHAISVLSSGSGFKLEDPTTPGSYANSVSIGSASRVRFWCYLGTSPGWKLVWGVF